MKTPDFPHLKYMNEMGLTPEKITVDYLVTELNSFASAKIKYDTAAKEATFASEEEREEVLTGMQDRLLSISESIYEDLQVEYPRNDGYMDVEQVLWPHIEYMKRFNVKTVDMPDADKKLITNFNARFNFIKEQQYDSPKEQEKDIEEAKKQSREIEKRVKLFLANKTTQDMNDFQEKKQAEKEEKIRQQEIDRLTNEIKDIVSKQHEFTNVLLKVDELSRLTDTAELLKWIEQEKTAYFKQLQHSLSPEGFLEKWIQENGRTISETQLGDIKEKVKLPKKSLVPSTMGGKTPSVVVGKYELVSIDFNDKWDIRDKKPDAPKKDVKDEKKDEKKKDEKSEKSEKSEKAKEKAAAD